PAALRVAHLELADPHRREEALVPGQHAEVALAAGNDHALDRSVERGPLRRHDGEGERHVQPYASRLAFSTASSMVPTLEKACSGSASCLPSRISLKPRMVSASFT